MRVGGCCIPKLVVVGWRFWGGTIGTGILGTGFFMTGRFARAWIEPGGRRLENVKGRTGRGSTDVREREFCIPLLMVVGWMFFWTGLFGRGFRGRVFF